MKALAVIPFEISCLFVCFWLIFLFSNSEVQFKIGMLEKGWALFTLFLLVPWAETTKHTGGVVCQENTHSDPGRNFQSEKGYTSLFAHAELQHCKIMAHCKIYNFY